MSPTRRHVLGYALLTGAGLLTGCTGGRKAPPPVVVDVLGPHRYRLQGVELDEAGLQRELTRLRDERYNHVTGTSMRRVMLRLHGSHAEQAAHHAMIMAQGLGMNHVSMHRLSQ